MKLMISLVKRHLWMFLTAIFFLCIETFADLLQPTFMSYMVDNGVKNQSLSTILSYGGIMLLIAAVGAVGAVIRNIYASRTSQIIAKELRSDLYKKVQTLSFENIDRLQPSSIITRITNDVTQIQNFINGCMRIMIKAPITCIGAIALIMLQTPKQIPVMIIILLVSLVLIALNMKLGYPRFGKMQKKLDKLNNVSREFLSSIRVVKAFNAEDDEQQKFSSAATELSDASAGAMRIMAIFAPLINLTVNLGTIALLWISGAQNPGQIGRLMASVNYMTQVLFALGMVSNILNTAVRAVASSSRVEEILNENPAQIEPETTALKNINGKVTFSNVTFTYSGTSRPAIENISFTANPGETIGIIGPTGSGKTSLINLIPRFYDATQGRVLIDGKDVTSISSSALRSGVAIVPQKALLFSGTIAENLRWGDEAADDETVIAAAKTSCADSFIQTFPQKYDTILGQGGVNISGGQKQRLSIARALLKNPKILILDDCTSALDAKTEAEVLNALNKSSFEMTVMLISQRISTVMRADKILCLEDGAVQGFGTHKELMENCATYKAIYTSQIGDDIVE